MVVNQGMQDIESSSLKRMKKIRVICYDPEATDSSSDDDDERHQHHRKRRPSLLRKHFVHEIDLPLTSGYRNQCTKSEKINNEAETLENKQVLEKRMRRSGYVAAEISAAAGAGVAMIADAASSQFNVTEMHDSESRLSGTSSSSIMEMDTLSAHMMSRDDPGNELLNPMLDVEASNEPKMPILGLIVDQYETLGEDVDMELGLGFLTDFDDLLGNSGAFEELEVPGFGCGKEQAELLDLDLDLGKEELAWIEEPFYVACCP
ncbi:hypothetical protein Droror1_Dr00022675 [Drosera rotundifolia]